MSLAFPTLGAAIAVAGTDKIAGYGGYNRMFRHLGWSRSTVQAVACAETAGGLMMVPAATRRFGGMVVAAVSTALLISEMRHGDAKLAVARGLVLLSGIAAVVMAKPAETSRR